MFSKPFRLLNRAQSSKWELGNEEVILDCNFECRSPTDLQQLVARLERPLSSNGSPGEDGADVVVGPHLLPLLHVDSALQGDPQSAVPLALAQKGHLKGKSNCRIVEGGRLFDFNANEV